MGLKSPQPTPRSRACFRRSRRDQFVAAVRALDRILISGFYVVPLYHLPDQWIAPPGRRWRILWDNSVFGYLPETWWRAAAGAASVTANTGDHA